MQSYIKLKPVFKQMLWGGNRLKETFNFDTDLDHIGEAWIVSAHPQGPSHILNGELKGQTLDQVYKTYREYFGPGFNKEFPILIKLIDAHHDLSVQVHPDDEYALKHEHDSGKYESWVFLETDEDSKLCIGHQAQSVEDFKSMVKNHQFDTLLRYIPVKQYDVFDIVPGTVHALCAGTMVYECQQNSNITYRIYDYDRQDNQGQLRELHLEKAFDVIKAPDLSQAIQSNSDVGALIRNPYFSLYKKEIEDEATFLMDDIFIALSVVEGHVYVNTHPLNQGESMLVLPQVKEIKIQGKATVLIAKPTVDSL